MKPVLAIVTLILKASGKYREGDFSWTSGYLYVTIVYNISICLALYCLGMFWLCINSDLKGFRSVLSYLSIPSFHSYPPLRPVPKFLCVKGILFFSFWQSLAISILVAAGVITKLGPYTDSEHISLGLTDTLICIEMPLFAIAHMYAFSHTDYIDPHLSFVARMPMYYAFRDAFGVKDVLEDSRATLKGKGMNYREFEPAEGHMHQGVGRDRRIRAGLRYSKGGKRKYWLPKPSQGIDTARWAERSDKRGIVGEQEGEVHAPLLTHTAAHMIEEEEESEDGGVYVESSVDGGLELPFGDVEDEDEELFNRSRKYLFGDYNYPCIDVSSEFARTTMWDEEERVLRDERGAWFSPIRGAKGRLALDRRDSPAWEGYGAIGTHPRIADERKGKRKIGSDGDGRSGEYTIDFEQDRTPPVETGDVRLKWTKSVAPSDPSSPASSSSRRLRGKDTRSPPPPPHHAGSSSTSPQSRSIRSATYLPTERTGSRPRSLPVVLPPDAVDLVVEDGLAREEEMTRDRRKGEPAVRGTVFKKMYRRELVSSEADVEEGRERKSRRTDSMEDAVGEVVSEDVQEVVSPLEGPSLDIDESVTVNVRGVSEVNPWA